MVHNQRAKLLLSTDSLSWYWLDLIFQTAKDIKFDGIDLALWKNFDARNIDYVKRLIKTYKIPVNVVQVSENVNRKEMNQAIDLAKVVWAEVISINSPYIFNIRTYKFLTNNFASYRNHNKDMKLSIINPPKSSLFVLPIPKYYFTNIVEIIKKYKAYLALDIANIEEVVLETTFLRKISNFLPYISTVYISDKTKTGKSHVPLWDGVLKLPTIFKKFKQNEYFGYFSLKLEIDKKDLADLDKVVQILKKCRLHYKENYQDLVIS